MIELWMILWAAAVVCGAFGLGVWCGWRLCVENTRAELQESGAWHGYTFRRHESRRATDYAHVPEFSRSDGG